MWVPQVHHNRLIRQADAEVTIVEALDHLIVRRSSPLVEVVGVDGGVFLHQIRRLRVRPDFNLRANTSNSSATVENIVLLPFSRSIVVQKNKLPQIVVELEMFHYAFANCIFLIVIPFFCFSNPNHKHDYTPIPNSHHNRIRNHIHLCYLLQVH